MKARLFALALTWTCCLFGSCEEVPVHCYQVCWEEGSHSPYNMYPTVSLFVLTEGVLEVYESDEIQTEPHHIITAPATVLCEPWYGYKLRVADEAPAKGYFVLGLPFSSLPDGPLAIH